jgi:hypothetical protein
VMEGKTGVIEVEAEPFSRKAGDAFIAFHQAKLELNAQEDTVIYRAAVPAGAL